MKDYLRSISRQLKNHSKSLDKKSILIDKPWAMIDEEFEMQKLIFKKNKELILSKNGKVQEGRWDYFPEAKSLLIDRGTDKILCNEAFVDEGVLILKMDGTDNQFFALANENVVPDLDVLKYLEKVRKTILIIETRNLSNGKQLEIIKDDKYDGIKYGNSVYIDNKPVKSGIYPTRDMDEYIQISNSAIAKIYNAEAFTSLDGEQYTLLKEDFFISKGDLVYKGTTKIKSAIVDYSKTKRFVVSNSKITKIIKSNPILNWLGIK